MNMCITCGMPFEGGHEKDLAFISPDGPVCVYDSKDGEIKSVEEIFKGGVTFFMNEATDGNRGLAEKITRKNMNALPYWQERPNPILRGEEATDEEFGLVMARL